jgi:hypothetical protein
MILWRADGRKLAPVRVQCPEDPILKRDADGFAIYINTHYPTEAEAWNDLQDNAAAGFQMAVEDLDRAQQNIIEAKDKVCKAATEIEHLRKNRVEAEGKK